MQPSPRNVIVTGGSRGLGLAIARRLVPPDNSSGIGYRVIAIARTTGDEWAELVQESEQRRRDSLRFVPFDLSDVQGIPELVRKIHAEVGTIYGLINNAASGTDGALAMMPNAEIEKLIRLNTLSPIVLSKYVVRHMLAEGGGRIVNISSIAAATGYSGLSVYSATKSSLVGFTRSLAREVGRLGVTVNAVAPGFMDTEMAKGADQEKIARRSALRRLAGVGDVAEAVEFLLGEGGKNITGTVLTIDAGATA